MKTISYKFENPLELYKSYMPFLLKGGVFIKTNDHYELDEEIECHLTLPNIQEEFIVPGKVKWITPSPANEGFTPGIGVHFTKSF